MIRIVLWAEAAGQLTLLLIVAGMIAATVTY